MRNLTKWHMLYTGVALTAMCAATPSLAESGDGSDIVVTARRVEERLQDVPIAITVYNQEQLSNRNVQTAGDLAATTPGLQVNSNVGSENTSFSLRGVTQNIGTSATVGVYFGDVVAPRGGSNGNFSGDGAGAGSFFDLQNVQVLKGPQGTLQGRNTTGGAVMLVPQKPSHELEGYVEGGIGNYNAIGVQGVINIPVNDTLRVRLGVDRQKRDGFVRNYGPVGPRDFSDMDYIAARASIVADLAPNLENYTIVSFSDSKTHGFVHKLIAYSDEGFLSDLLDAPAQLATQADLGFYNVFSQMPDAGVHKRSWQAINTTTWQANDNLTIKNIASYAELRQTTNSQIFGTDFHLTNYLAGGNPLDPSTWSSWPIYTNMMHSAYGLKGVAQATFTEELQFQGRAMDSKLKWQAGLYYEKSTPLGASGNQLVSTGMCEDAGGGATLDNCYGVAVFGGSGRQIARTTYESKALYGQATYDFTDKLSLTGGFRYTWDKMSSRALEEYYTMPVGLEGGYFYSTPDMNPATMFPGATYCMETLNPGPCSLVNASQKSKAPTWLIDIDYKPTRDILLYAKYARGYRAGGVKNDAPNLSLLDPALPNFQKFKPEKEDSFEVGLKSSFRGAISGVFNIAGYYNKFSDQQVMEGFFVAPAALAGGPCADPTLPCYDVSAAGSPGSFPINIGKSRIYGIDADMTLNLFKGFTLTGGYSYINSKITHLDHLDNIQFNNAYMILVPTSAVLGKPLLFTPKNKFTINGTYTLPLPESAGKLSVGLTFTHTDKQYATFAEAPAGSQYVLHGNQVVQDDTPIGLLQPTNLLDLNVNWKNVLGKPLDITFWATNITKKKYYDYVDGLIGEGFDLASLAPPRMYGVKAKVHF